LGPAVLIGWNRGWRSGGSGGMHRHTQAAHGGAGIGAPNAPTFKRCPQGPGTISVLVTGESSRLGGRQQAPVGGLARPLRRRDWDRSNSPEPDQTSAMVQEYAAGATQRELATKHGVHQSTLRSHARRAGAQRPERVTPKCWPTSPPDCQRATSTWVEGECCELAAFGHSRDRKKGRRQAEFALIAAPDGTPVGVLGGRFGAVVVLREDCLCQSVMPRRSRTVP
jgi:transposase-like protein